ncbi:MAG: DMT family transporter [Pseudomonadota bacterium]
MGDLLAFLAALCWAASGVTIALGAKDKSGDNGAFLSILITLLLAAAVWLVIGWGAGTPTLDGMGMLWFAVAGALTIFVGRVFFHSSIQWLGSVRSSSVKRMSPFFSVLLGVTLLDEPVTHKLVLGMVLIFGGFGILIRESMVTRARAEPAVPGAAPAGTGFWSNPGFAYGTISALAYAAGNIARKFGLLHLPDPALGVLVGSVTGALLFVATALVVQSYRAAVWSTFHKFNPWLLAAGVLASAGQLLFFAAIEFSTVSRVALIGSTEVFLTMLIVVLLVRNREKVTSSVVVAAVMGLVGAGIILTDRAPAAPSQAPSVSLVHPVP